ncbi:MAG: penicillin-binding protein 1A [Flavobacteriaceae bacterium]
MAKVKTKKTKINKEFTKFIRWFWTLFFLGILLVVSIFVSASIGVFGDMPDYTVLENPKTNLATEVLSSDGQLLGKYYYRDNRTLLDYKQISPNLVDALIATEDARFYSHSGIDARGTLRALVYLGSKGGASTISQQLARQLFIGVRDKEDKVNAIFQKVKEWVLAIRLERQYTKEEIIAMYFNIYDFNNNADGIKSAASIYFNKTADSLSIEESAMLVGMFKNSSLYNPRRNTEGTTNRRNVVLSQMHKYGYISQQLKDSLQKRPLNLEYTPQSHKTGLATYFRAYIKSELKKWINNNPKSDGTKYDLYRDGLKIYTTIDSRMQNYAEQAVVAHMKNLQAAFDKQNTPKENPTAPFIGLEQEEIDALMKRSMRQSERWRHMRYDLKKNKKEIEASFYEPVAMKIFSWKGEIDTVMKPIDSMRYYKTFLHPGLMSMDPKTGHVKAWVGGMNYKHFQYDHVKQGKRQVGSTFKPFVYATAIDQLHKSPCDTMPRSQITIEANKFGNLQAWSAKNSDGQYGGFMTLKDALANSTNTVTARLMNEVGPKPVVKMAKNLGIEQDILAVPAIALGTPDLSVYEMVAAYGTFANKGVYTKPVMLTRIEDKNGTVLFQFTPQTRDVLSEEVAYVTVNLLEGVTQSGSGIRLRHSTVDNPVYKEIVTGYPYAFENPIAGKTGTTQNQSDGWFMGMVPNLVTGVWVGAEDRAAHFKTIAYGQGASMALPIWGIYMKKCYEDTSLDISQEEFEVPENLSIKVDCVPINTEGQPVIEEPEEIIDFDL